MADNKGSIPKPDFSQVQNPGPAKPEANPVRPQPAMGAPTGAPKPDFSNVQSGSSSTAPTVKVEHKTYIVKPGDSLSKIAKHEYGDARYWHHIFAANHDTIKNPDLIHPGQVLKMPTEQDLMVKVPDLVAKAKDPMGKPQDPMAKAKVEPLGQKGTEGRKA